MAYFLIAFAQISSGLFVSPCPFTKPFCLLLFLFIFLSYTLYFPKSIVCLLTLFCLLPYKFFIVTKENIFMFSFMASGFQSGLPSPWTLTLILNMQSPKFSRWLLSYFFNFVFNLYGVYICMWYKIRVQSYLLPDGSFRHHLLNNPSFFMELKYQLYHTVNSHIYTLGLFLGSLFYSNDTFIYFHANTELI